MLRQSYTFNNQFFADGDNSFKQEISECNENSGK